MIPAKATAAPVRSEEARNTMRLDLSTSTPSAAAFSSPTAKRFSLPANASRTAKPAATYGAKARTLQAVAAARRPVVQERIVRAVWPDATEHTPSRTAGEN